MKEDAAPSIWLIDGSRLPRYWPRGRTPINKGVLEFHDTEGAKPQSPVAKLRHQPVIKSMALPLFATFLVALFVGQLSAILFLAYQLLRH